MGELSELRKLIHSPYKRPSERLRAALEKVLDFGQPLAWEILFEELRSARWEAASLAKTIDLVQTLLGGGVGPSLSESRPKSQQHRQERRDSAPAVLSCTAPASYLEVSDVSEDEDFDPRPRVDAAAVERQRLREEAQCRARLRLAEALLKASKVAGDATDLDALQECMDALMAAIAEAQDGGLPDSELLESTRGLQELAKARIACLLKAAQDVDRGSITALRFAKEQLDEAIQDAKKHGVSEADLVVAENCRRRFHNTIEDLKGNIRVFCRIRPLNAKEIERGDVVAVKATDSMTLEVDRSKTGFGRYTTESDSAQQFAFDSVFNPASQQEVFQDCKDLLQSAFDGYNVTIFAYGQTGSGKTFTMTGRPGQPGLAPQLIDEIYRIARRDAVRFGHRVTASMLELYRNDLVDLLPPLVPGGSAGDSPRPPKVSIRMDRDGHVQTENVSEEECPDEAALAAVLERGTAARKTAATAMNSESSRSHLILTVRITRTNRETGAELKGKITLMDLAGSERLKKSMVSGEQQKEAIEINRSLTALGDVIEALTQGQAAVPYRNHKLTQILQDSLGRTAKTLMFVHCAPTVSNVEETVASLKYAVRAKRITPGQNAAPARGSISSAEPSFAERPVAAPLRTSFAACPPTDCPLDRSFN
jgi:hypothetical protein